MEFASSCSIGVSLCESCHVTKYTRKCSLKTIFELECEEQNLLQLKCNLTFSSEDTIRLHHEHMYIHKYSNWQLTCMDPWQLRKKKISYKYLKTLNSSEAQAVNELHKLSDELSIKPEQKLCHDCFNASNSCKQLSIFYALESHTCSSNELDDSYHESTSRS